MKILSSIVLSACIGLGCGGQTPQGTTPVTQAPPLEFANTTEAARALMEMMNMDAVVSTSIEQTLEMQIKANPSIGSFRPVMEKFLKKHMSWDAIADETIQMYADAYEQSELEALVRFYRTPTGTKSIKLLPQLMKQGAELGARRVQENMPELEAMIQASMMQQTSGAESPGQ